MSKWKWITVNPDNIAFVLIIFLVLISMVVGFVTEKYRNTNKVVEVVVPLQNTVTLDDTIEFPVCSAGTFKSWMDYRSITAPNSEQYKLQSLATTNQATGIREYKGHLMVAMASSYGPVGTTYEVMFESRQKIKVIVGDIKADTDCEHSDGSMIEFIVDKNMIDKSVLNGGNFNNIFVGQIISITE